MRKKSDDLAPAEVQGHHPSRLIGVLFSVVFLIIGAGLTFASASHETAASSSAPVTLTVMHWNPEMVDQSSWWKDILDGFSVAHPNVTVKNDFVAFPQYLTTLETMSAANRLPEVFFAHVMAEQLGRAGLTVDFKKVFPASFFKQFYPGPIRQFTFGSHVYALPWNAQIFGLFVDTPVMQSLGLTPPDTWGQLIGMAPKINQAGYTPLMWGNQAHNVAPDFFLPLIRDYGGNVYALDELAQPGLSWNSPPVTRALELFKRLQDAGVFVKGIDALTEDQGWQLAFQGKAAMLWTHDSANATIAQQAPKSYVKSYTVAQNPALTAGGVHWSGDGSGDGWAVSAHSPNEKMALAFMKYLFSPKVYNEWIKGSQNMPSMPSAVDMVSNPKERQMTGWLEKDGTDHILYGKGSWNAVSNVLQGVLEGSIQPAQGAALIESQVLAARAR